MHFPSYFSLFQAVGNDPVPLCHVSHISAHIPGDHAPSPPHPFLFSRPISPFSLVNTTLPALVGRKGQGTASLGMRQALD